MSRDLPLGNGSLLVAFDGNYQIRDLYWPHVGQENHAMGHPFRMGAWVDGEFRWLDDSHWEHALRYSHETLVTEVRLRHSDLNLSIAASDAVDFHENLLVRRFDVVNLSDRDRDVRLFFHHDFHIAGNEVGDTAYYEPDRRAVLHYKGSRWFLANGAVVQAAIAAGMNCIAVATPFTRTALHAQNLLAPKWIMDDPGTLPAVVEDLLRGRSA